MTRARRVVSRWALALCALPLAACVDRLVGPNPSTSPTAVFDAVWQDFDRNYSSFDVKGVDWNAVYARYKPRADSLSALAALPSLLGAMFGELHDLHVDLAVGGGVVYHSVDISTVRTYFNPLAVFTNYVPSSTATPSRDIRYGAAGESIGLIWLPTFAGAMFADEIDEAIAAFPNARALVIDVRDNGGGSTNNAIPIAGRFVDATRTFAYYRYRNGPAHSDFTDYQPLIVTPRGRRFSGAIYVLINRRCASATEAFLFAMRSQPGVTFVGDTTAGAMGNPMIRDLPNGWEYRMPQWLEYDASKRLLEGIGIAPDVYVASTLADSAAGKDAQLEAALALAAQPKPQ